MSVKGNQCGFCKIVIGDPCSNSTDASRCRFKANVATVETQADVDAIMEKATGGGLAGQVGGNHYTRMKIQPITYIEANELGFCEGNVVKYVSRWKFKNGIQDLEKARDILTKKIAMEKEKLNAKT